MPSKARLKFLKKMIILGPKTAILGPQFCRILVLGPHFWWSGGAQAPRAPPGSAPGFKTNFRNGDMVIIRYYRYLISIDGSVKVKLLKCKKK